MSRCILTSLFGLKIFYLSPDCCIQRSVWVARKPPGFAFIDFDDKRDAEDALRDIDGNTTISLVPACLNLGQDITLPMCI